MSTRCNVVITDGHSTLWFYRHSDGYGRSVVRRIVAAPDVSRDEIADALAAT